MAENGCEETSERITVTDLVRRFEVQNGSRASERASVSDSTKHLKKKSISKIGAIRRKELDALLEEKDKEFSFVRLQLKEDIRVLDLHHAAEILEATKRCETKLKEKEELLHSIETENERLKSVVKEQADEVSALKIERRDLKDLLQQRIEMWNNVLRKKEERDSILNGWRQQIKEILDEITECQKQHIRKEAKLTFYQRVYARYITALESVYKKLFERVLKEQKYYCSEIELLTSELVINENEANEEAEEIYQWTDEIESLRKKNASLEESIDNEGNISNLLDQLDEYEDVIEGLQVAKKEMEKRLMS